MHIADDVARFHALDRVLAFPFECFLGKLKQIVRKPNFPLQQVIRKQDFWRYINISAVRMMVTFLFVVL